MKFKQGFKNFFKSVGVRAALITAIGIIVVAGMYIANSRSKLAQDNQNYIKEIAKQKDAIHSLEQEVLKRDNKIQLLETQLTPFKTIALEKYTGSEQEALQQLAQDIQKIKNKANELENQIQKRSISNEQKEILISRLKGANNKKILITAIMGDQESLQFAHILKDIFLEAGWDVNGVNQAMYTTPMLGLWLTIIEEPAPEEANIIYQAFRMMSFSIKGQRNPQQKEQLQLIVGSK